MDFFTIQINTAIAGVFVLLLIIFRYLSSWRSRKVSKNHAPPEASGAWPIIGHLHLLGGGTKLPHIALGSLADKHGPIFTIRLGVHKALVVNSSELAKELFTTHDLVTSSRPQFLAAKYLGYNYAMFAFSPYGSYWREVRKITSLELLSNHRLELLKNVRISETDTSVNELYKLWNEKKNGLSGSVLVDMKKWLGNLTLNVVVKMVAGKRYFGDVVVNDEIEAKKCRKVMRDFFYLLGVFVLGDWVPLLGFLDIGDYEKAMKVTTKEMDSILEGWLAEHRRKKVAGEGGDGEDFMDVMMSAVDSAIDLAGYDPDTIVKATCMVLIAAGTDTTHVVLIWALSLLLNNRHVLKKAQEELDKHVGNKRRVDEADIDKLLYLQAIVKETLRLYPAAPFSGPREFTEDCVVGGYQVSKGTRLIMNLWKIQRDPNVWLDPSEFRPERFLTTYKDIDVKGHHFELIPFGAGRRICSGTTFALQMVHLVLANLLHAFDISTPSDAPVDMTESAGLTNIKATPLDVLVAPRLSSRLY